MAGKFLEAFGGGRGSGGKEEPGGLPVQAGEEMKVRVALFPEECPEGVGKVATGGVDGEAGGLGDDQQIVLRVDYLELVGNGWFRQVAAAVFDGVALGQLFVSGGRFSIAQDAASCQRREPGFARVIGEALDQEVE